MTRVALISATPAAIGPATAALGERFPAADLWNLLDDKLLADARNGVTPELAERMRRLIAYAVHGGADAVLLTCSLYGQLARTSTASVPVLAPDDAAFDDVLARAPRRVLVLASIAAALHDSVTRLRDRAPRLQVVGVHAPEAFAATGDTKALTDILLRACQQESTVDSVLLAQYSLAPATVPLAAATGLPVFSGPRSAAARLKALVGQCSG
ncbi:MULTISPECIES: aspartate/glutamate racemase family protein [unclassified Crossiella]|uniref:aspartate/glutamate racemase family protein n=1 Tax=unclassified Crossiella TaxID=2620835 RepID=UPI00200017FB|nr:MULTISPECIES: aspartate/glutamate racemase family protein [unclassified Crossiella]MCK2244464.1 aspartate/glutamate racemase family protein [Crossiella sp. S99.2]MCK2258095.1 aspartate/glutamate racemase family protein [Crossiella sp. S99.1]